MRPAGQPDGPPVPSVAGLLGTDPQHFFPQARVAVVQYAGPQMGERFLKQEIEGPQLASATPHRKSPTRRPSTTAAIAAPASGHSAS